MTALHKATAKKNISSLTPVPPHSPSQLQTHSEPAVYYYEIVKVRCGLHKGDRKTMLCKTVPDHH